MLLGHYGLALATKRALPTTSLGLMTFAAQWLDELWPILLLLGLESVRIVPQLMAASPFDFIHYPWSHSLLAAVLWSLVIGGGCYVFRRRRREAFIIGALVLSHWVLDAPMHRPDLPLWPGSAAKVGFGLWNSITLTLLIEVAVFGAGLALYMRTTRALNRIGSWGLYAMATVLLLVFLSGLMGPPPASGQAFAVFVLGLWLFVPWSAWVDRHRESRQPADHTAR